MHLLTTLYGIKFVVRRHVVIVLLQYCTCWIYNYSLFQSCPMYPLKRGPCWILSSTTLLFWRRGFRRPDSPSPSTSFPTSLMASSPSSVQEMSRSWPQHTTPVSATWSRGLDWSEGAWLQYKGLGHSANDCLKIIIIWKRDWISQNQY